MSSDDHETESAPETDDLKAKFREALERKNRSAREREGEAHLDGTSGAHGAKGRADHRREFRRKSG